MVCKHGHSGGRHLFEVLYEKEYIPLNYNLQRIIVECIVYDSELEADHYDRERFKQKQTQDKFTISPKIGVREMKFAMWERANYPEYVNAEVTLLTKKEFSKIESAYNNRNTSKKS